MGMCELGRKEEDQAAHVRELSMRRPHLASVKSKIMIVGCRYLETKEKPITITNGPVGKESLRENTKPRYCNQYQGSNEKKSSSANLDGRRPRSQNKERPWDETENKKFPRFPTPQPAV